MEKWNVNLARMFKERENKSPKDVAIAKIINSFPDIKIALGEEILLELDDLVISNRIYGLTLYPGDEVILIPTSNGQMYYLIDKVGR